MAISIATGNKLLNGIFSHGTKVINGLLNRLLNHVAKAHEQPVNREFLVWIRAPAVSRS